MKCLVKHGELAKEVTDVLVLAGYEDDKTLPKSIQGLDKALNGALHELHQSGEFKGTQNQTVVFHTRGAISAKRILLVGLGKRNDCTLDRIRQAAATCIKRVRQVSAQSCALPAFGSDTVKGPQEVIAQAIVEGAILGDYRFTHYRTDKKDAQSKEVSSLTVLVPSAGEVSDTKIGVRRGEVSGLATTFVRDLCNHPANVLTPSRVVEEARKIAKEKGVSLKVLEKKDQEKLGMGGLLGVSRGSIEPAKFLILEYNGGGKANKPIVLVGKTVTFDSGGISLKPSENMEQMKADMTGGAEVLATIRAAAQLRLPLHIIGLLPVTENMPGGRATKPGDVLNMLNGKTVEVQNTDAEGRLILADGLAFASRFKPQCIVDVATLTGACAVALGQFAIGMMGTDDSLKKELSQAGIQAGERVWEMPLWDEYFEQLKSDVADMRNIGGRGGGMITAAVFLSKFVDDFPWVHLDIASTDWSTSERAYIPKGPTGIGTRLLLQFLLNRANRTK